MLPAIIALAVFLVPARAGELAAGVSQRVIRINVIRGPGVQPRTLADCFDSEDCLIQLTRALEQSGGNPGMLKRGETGVAKVEGLKHSFSFAPAGDEQFCAMEFLKPSVAPTFLSRAPELWLEISAREAKLDIFLPGNAPTSWVDGFIVLYGARPDAKRACTLTDKTMRYHCKGRCEAMRF